MNILNFDQQNTPLQLHSSLLHAFQQLKFFPINSPTPHFSSLQFSGVVSLSRAQQYLYADFKVKKIKEKQIKLQMSLNPSMCSFSRWLLEFFLKKFQQVCHFIHINNHLQLSEREGILEFSESSGNIIYKTSIHSIFMVTSKTKRQAVILSHLRKMLRVYSNTLENLIFYYRIPGFSLNQLHLMLQQQNAVQLKSVAEKVILLKALFDSTTHSNESYERYKQQLKSSQLVLNGASSLDALYSSKIKPEYFVKIESEFKYEEKTLIKNFDEFQRSKIDSILTAIEIKHKGMEQLIAQGGFCSITYGLYDYVPLLSVHQQTNNAILKQKQLEGKKENSQYSPHRTGCCLVKKTSLNKQVMNQSFKNQCIFLTYMKAKICPYFAKYYCNKGLVPFADGQVYIQYYPTSLDQTRLKQQGKLKVLEEVCMGLLFLSKEQILHRDLKELNIMVDRSKRSRIIDFGSVAPFIKSQKFKLQDTKLRSTEGYFYSYRNICLNYPQLSMVYNKEEYYRHPNFDMYSLGRIIHNQFSLQLIIEEEDLLRHFLHYLTVRCFEVDPKNRWSIGQVLCFLRQLLSYIEHKNRYWKYGFDQQCKVHKIGSTFSTKQYSNEERSAQQSTIKSK